MLNRRSFSSVSNASDGSGSIHEINQLHSEYLTRPSLILCEGKRESFAVPETKKKKIASKLTINIRERVFNK